MKLRRGKVKEARVKGAPDLCMRYPATGAERMKRNQCQDRSRMTGMNAVVMISGRTHCRYTTILSNILFCNLKQNILSMVSQTIGL